MGESSDGGVGPLIRVSHRGYELFRSYYDFPEDGEAAVVDVMLTKNDF
jgi:hypothetical protein